MTLLVLVVTSRELENIKVNNSLFPYNQKKKNVMFCILCYQFSNFQAIGKQCLFVDYYEIFKNLNRNLVKNT